MFTFTKAPLARIAIKMDELNLFMFVIEFLPGTWEGQFSIKL